MPETVRVANYFSLQPKVMSSNCTELDIYWKLLINMCRMLKGALDFRVLNISKAS